MWTEIDEARPTDIVGRPGRGGRQSPVALRILAAAAPMLYMRGVHAVSADAVIAAADVTKATFYRHFPTKDDLVVAYLTAAHEGEVQAVDRWRTELPGEPGKVLRRYAEMLGEASCVPGYHGCPFVNATAEYPDAGHPARQVVARHRDWLDATAAALLAQLGVPTPERLARQLVMLRDGFAVAADAAGSDPHLRAAALDDLIDAATILVRAALG